MTKFAQGTAVSVDKSRAEIERMIVRYGATATAFFNGPGLARIMFECKNRRVSFELPLPRGDDPRFAVDGNRRRRTPSQRVAAWEQHCRQKWRALALVIKAKLEAVESGITSFEDEFLAHIVLPDGVRVGDRIKPAIERMYQGGEMLPLLPAPSH
jgi:hypothetical protein